MQALAPSSQTELSSSFPWGDEFTNDRILCNISRTYRRHLSYFSLCFLKTDRRLWLAHQYLYRVQFYILLLSSDLLRTAY